MNQDIYLTAKKERNRYMFYKVIFDAVYLGLVPLVLIVFSVGKVVPFWLCLICGLLMFVSFKRLSKQLEETIIKNISKMVNVILVDLNELLGGWTSDTLIDEIVREVYKYEDGLKLKEGTLLIKFLEHSDSIYIMLVEKGIYGKVTDVTEYKLVGGTRLLLEIEDGQKLEYDIEEEN